MVPTEYGRIPPYCGAFTGLIRCILTTSGVNVLAKTFGGAIGVLPHLTWPIVPHDDESLAGLTTRTSAHNGIWTPSVLTADAGLRLPKGLGRLPIVSRDLGDLATILAVEPSWVEGRRPRFVDKQSELHPVSRTPGEATSACLSKSMGLR